MSTVTLSVAFRFSLIEEECLSDSGLAYLEVSELSEAHALELGRIVNNMHRARKAGTLLAKAAITTSACPVAPIVHICGWYDIY